MKRREALKWTARGIGAAAIAPSILILEGCGSTTQLVTWTNTVIDALTQLSPILNEMGATGVVALVARAIPIATKLRDAFKANNHVSTLSFIDQLINPQTGIIIDLANSVAKLSGPTEKTILGIMAIAEVALHLIAANVATVPAAAATAARAANPSAVATIGAAADSNSLLAAFNAARFSNHLR